MTNPLSLTNPVLHLTALGTVTKSLQANGDEHVASVVDATASKTYTPASYTPAVFVDAISPTTGWETLRVSIRVSDTTHVTGASVGGVALTSFTVDDATHVSGVLGAHALGAVNVTVTSTGAVFPLVNGFTYVTTPLAITSITPSSGADDAPFVLAGTGFLRVIDVTGNGFTLPGYVINSDFQISATHVPEGPAFPYTSTIAITDGTDSASITYNVTSGPSVLDLTTLAWTILAYSENYVAATPSWHGTASAGVSGNSTQYLVKDGTRNAPTAAGSLDGHTTVRFARASSQSLLNNRSDQFPASTGATTFYFIAVLKYNAGSHNNAAGTWYSNDLIFGDDAPRWGFAIRSTGEAQIGVYNGAALVGKGAAGATGQFIIAEARSDGTTIEVRTGGSTGTWQTLGSANVGSGRGVMHVGVSWDGTAFLDADVAMLGIMPTRPSDTLANSIAHAVRVKYPSIP